MTTRTWNGGHASSNNWTEAANWGGTAPVAGDDLVFAGTTRLSPNNNFAADTSFASITFDSSAGAFTIGGNRITVAGDIATAATNEITISLDMIFNGNIPVGGNGTSIVVSGVISGSFGLNKNGTSMVTLSALNTFTGAVKIVQGVLKINTIKNVSGGPSSLGAPITSENGKITFRGFDNSLVYYGSGNDTNREIYIEGDATKFHSIEQNGTGNLKFSGAWTFVNTSGKQFEFKGSTSGTGEISAAIPDPNPGTYSIAITKSGTGKWKFSAANTYTGTTSISAGELSVTGSTSSSSAVTVSSNAILSGNGTVAGSVTVLGGGKVEPGVASEATLNTGALMLNSTSILNYGLGTSSDKIAVTGNLTLDGTINVTDVTGFGPASYTILTYSGSLTNNTLSGGTLPAGYTANVSASGGFVYLLVNRIIPPASTLSSEAFGAASVLRGNVNVAPSSIATAEAIGTAALAAGNVNVAPSGIASGEAFGTAKLDLNIQNLIGIPSDENFGVPVLTFTISPVSIDSEESIGSAQLNLNIQNLVGISSQEGLGTPALSAGPVDIAAPSIPSAEDFGTALTGVQLWNISSIDSLEGFGIVSILVGGVLVVPDGLESLEIIGAQTVLPGPVNIVTASIPSQESFGVPLIVYTINPVSIASSEMIGAATVLPGPVSVQPNSIITSESVSQPVVLPGSVSIAPQAISGQDQVNSPILSVGVVYISPEGIVPGAVGNPIVTPVVWLITGAGKIPSQEDVSFPIVHPTLTSIIPTSIDSAELFGSPKINMSVSLFGIASAEAFGEPVINEGGIVISIPSVLSSEIFGSTILRNLWVLKPTGISSSESVQGILATRFIRSSFQQDLEDDLDNVFFHNSPEFSEQIQYIHKDGVVENFLGVFDNEYTGVNIEAGAQIMSSAPVVWMHSSKFRHRPTKGDKVIVRGIRFQLTEYQPDGTGVSMLILHRESVK